MLLMQIKILLLNFITLQFSLYQHILSPLSSHLGCSLIIPPTVLFFIPMEVMFKCISSPKHMFSKINFCMLQQILLKYAASSISKGCVLLLCCRLLWPYHHHPAHTPTILSLILEQGKECLGQIGRYSLIPLSVHLTVC